MYDRKIAKQTITLQVSGMLWQRSLVMRDIETGSLWSHLLGKSMQGKLKGNQLVMIPAAMTTWGEWKSSHPKTTVLAMSRTADRFRDQIWQNPKRQKSFVFGIRLGAGQPAPAISLTYIQKKRFHQITTGGQTILFTYATHGQRIQAFSCTLDGKSLKFTMTPKGKLTDSTLVSPSTWNPITGKCIDGPLKGKQLQPIPGTISYRKSWNAFYPEEPIIE